MVVSSADARLESTSARPAAWSAWWTERRVWFVATVAFAFAAAGNASNVFAVDTFYSLYSGRFVVTRGLPRVNALTLVHHGAPWIDQQWLAHVVYYAAWTAGGYPAVALLSSLVLTSGFAVLALAMRGRGVPPARAFLWTCGTLIVYLGNIVICDSDNNRVLRIEK